MPSCAGPTCLPSLSDTNRLTRRPLNVILPTGLVNRSPTAPAQRHYRLTTREPDSYFLPKRREEVTRHGWFVISDFPFPATDDGLRSVPGRIMCGIQFFEAQIDDQLLPRASYDQLLSRHGFIDIGSVQLTPMHAITYARRSAR